MSEENIGNDPEKVAELGYETPPQGDPPTGEDEIGAEGGEDSPNHTHAPTPGHPEPDDPTPLGDTDQHSKA